MSRRNTRREKALRRLERALVRPLPAQIDLVDWLKLHGHAQTTGEAVRIIRDERVKAGSHTLGLDKRRAELIDPFTGRPVDPFTGRCDAKLRGEIRVNAPVE